MVMVQWHAQGPRVYVFGRRIHHGALGVLLASTGLARHIPTLALAGILLAAHDAADWRLWGSFLHAPLVVSRG